MNGRIITFVVAALVMLTTATVQAKDVKYSFGNAPSVTFSHDSHLAKNRDCKTCHSAIFDLSKHRSYTMAEMEKGKSCGACHNGKKAFSVATEKDCLRCHRAVPSASVYKISAGDASEGRTMGRQAFADQAALRHVLMLGIEQDEVSCLVVVFLVFQQFQADQIAALRGNGRLQQISADGKGFGC